MRKFFEKKVLMMAACFAGMDLEDQYSQDVQWEAFCEMPQILVFAGKEASDAAKKWGAFFQKELNGDYLPSKDHLQSKHESEKVKVIGVAALPSVPGIFKGLFRGGFRDESTMPMILDFGSELSARFKVDGDEKLPTLVFFKAGAKDEDAVTWVEKKAWASEAEARNFLNKKIKSAL